MVIITTCVVYVKFVHDSFVAAAENHHQLFNGDGAVAVTRPRYRAGPSEHPLPPRLQHGARSARCGVGTRRSHFPLHKMKRKHHSLKFTNENTQKMKACQMAKYASQHANQHASQRQKRRRVKIFISLRKLNNARINRPG